MDALPTLSRRRWLTESACGFGMLALAGMCRPAAANPLAPKAPHFAPRAKRILFLFMQGGPSQVDTFDPKPRLQSDNGKRVRFYNSRRRAEQQEQILGSPWKFTQYGESGAWVSELFRKRPANPCGECFGLA